MSQNDSSLELSQKVMVDAVCLQFEQDWRNGLSPKIESFLEHHPETEQDLILPQLLLLELE